LCKFAASFFEFIQKECANCICQLAQVVLYNGHDTVLLLHYTHLTASFRSTWVSRYKKDKTSLDLNEARDDGVFLDAVASAGPYANNLLLAPDR